MQDSHFFLKGPIYGLQKLQSVNKNDIIYQKLNAIWPNYCAAGFVWVEKFVNFYEIDFFRRNVLIYFQHLYYNNGKLRA